MVKIMSKSTQSSFSASQVTDKFQEVSNVLTESARKVGDLNVKSAYDAQEALTSYVKAFDVSVGKSFDVGSVQRIHEQNISLVKQAQDGVTRYWSEVFGLVKSAGEKLTGALSVA